MSTLAAGRPSRHRGPGVEAVPPDREGPGRDEGSGSPGAPRDRGDRGDRGERGDRGYRAAVVAVTLSVLLFVRPGIFSALHHLAFAGAIPVAALAVFTFTSGRSRTLDPPLRSALIWVSAVWVWNLAQPIFTAGPTQGLGQGVVTVPVTFALLLYAMGPPAAREMVVRAVAVTTIVMCASFVVTFLLWTATSYSSFALVHVMTSDLPKPQPVFFPLTTTYGSLGYSGHYLDSGVYTGTLIPRFLGYARESGIMQCYITWTYFMLRRIGWNRWPYRALLLAGLLGTQSTAGFGGFVVVWAMDSFILVRGGVPPYGSPERRRQVVRQCVGALLLGGALVAAFLTPVYGLQAKERSNGASVTIRLDATSSGLGALFTHPFGEGLRSEADAGVNLLSSGGPYGAPFVLLSLVVFWRVHRLSSDRALSWAPIVTVFLTVLISQPLRDSTFLYFLMAIAACSFRGDADAVLPRRRRARARGRGTRPRVGRDAQSPIQVQSGGVP